MSKNTKIEWAHHTFNPWVGCTKVSPACDHCYAEAWAKRSGMVQWGAQAERRRTSESNWRQPIKWNAEAGRTRTRYRVFCSSLADVFDNTVPTQWRIDLMKLICETPHLDWLLLTKRIGNASVMLEDAFRAAQNQREGWADNIRSNVWIGATICNQEEADRDIPKLLRVPAAKRFLSVEPLLGPLTLSRLTSLDYVESPEGAEVYPLRGIYAVPDCDWPAPKLDWVIAGGESGPNARPMHPAWVRNLRDQCVAANVPFLFKQHGEWLATDFCDDDMAMIPSKKTVYVSLAGSFHDGSNGVDFFGGEEETAWVGKRAAGRVLDGKLWDEVPINESLDHHGQCS